jgi:hypothetical protein
LNPKSFGQLFHLLDSFGWVWNSFSPTFSSACSFGRVWNSFSRLFHLLIGLSLNSFSWHFHLLSRLSLNQVLSCLVEFKFRVWADLAASSVEAEIN